MWMRHSCFTNLVSLCVDLRAIVVRLCSQFKFKKEYPLVLETRTEVPIRPSRCPVIVSTTRVGQAVWVDRVSPFKEYLGTSRPSPPTSPPCPLGLTWASSSSARKLRRISSHFVRAVEFVSDMAEPSQTQMTKSSPLDIGASASITAPLFPSLAPTSSSAVRTPTPPSATRSGSSSNSTSRKPSSTTPSSEPPSSTRGGVSTAPSSEVASSHTAGSRTSLQTSSTASLSSSSRSASSSSSSRPLSSASASESLTSAPPSSSSESASVSSSGTTSVSRSSVMSSSTSPRSSSSSPVASSPSDLSASFSPTSTPNGNNTILSSSTMESSASRTFIFQSPTAWSSSLVASLPSSHTGSSSSETPSPTPNPVAGVTSITVVSTTTLTTHIPASSSTGILRPGDYARSGFANNTGAIVGVSVAATAGLLALAVLIFFTCRKYRSRVSHNESTDRILALARNVSWRTPVDGSLAGSLHEKVFYAKSGSASPPLEETYDHSSDEHRDEFGSISRSNGTIEHPDYLAMHRPMNPTFGGQSYVPAHADPRRPDPAAFPTQMYPFVHIPGSSTEWRPADPFEHEDDPVSTRSYGPTRSETALVFPGWSSPSEHGVMPHSTAYGTWGATDSAPRTRNSVSGPRAMLGSMQKSRRHSSTPPSAFMGSHDDATTDQEGQSTLHDSQADRMSVKSIMSIFKSARRASSQSLASTIKSLPFTRLTDQEPIPTLSPRRDQMVGSSNIYSPSLLNPPIALPPQPLLSFPRGVTGHGYDPHQSATLWPPPTLPPAPDSPAPTDDSSMIEGLLHPRLALEGLRQASQTSFRDNEDYSRPISGLVKNHHLRSTTTIDTPDTAESEDGTSTLGRGIAY
ncbi:hypothetical protein D9619_011354 [Psilocybe cf. subviscida]|uniref:REJ domain-containing protein n=1 Tax=Psilocybe cf. subviscida TaxID=2480587 RepID=A0A8H5BK80_9AGAR|nr:hypothetical protein D9619_011354 [Psilocybe cf. subviscida]